MLPPVERIQPSRAGRMVACPGSVVMEAARVDTGDAWKEGTQIHEIAAHELSPATQPGTAGHHPEGPQWCAGKTGSEGLIITEEAVDVAEFYLRTLRAGGHPIIAEMKVGCHSVHPLCNGTPDAWWYDDASRTLYLWDLKTGWGIVEAVGNPQMASYLSGIRDHLAGNGRAAPMGYHATIVQPRPWLPDGPVRTWSLGAAELDAALAPIQTAAALATGPDPRCHSGPHCRYCLARADCPATRAVSMHMLDEVARALPDEMAPEAVASEIRFLRGGLSVLKPRLEALESQAEAMISAGVHLPGWVLERGRGSRYWTKPPEALRQFGSAIGVELMEEKLISPKQAEDRGMPKDMIAALSKKTEGRLKLAPGDAAEAARKAFGYGPS